MGSDIQGFMTLTDQVLCKKRFKDLNVSVKDLSYSQNTLALGAKDLLGNLILSVPVHKYLICFVLHS